MIAALTSCILITGHQMEPYDIIMRTSVRFFYTAQKCFHSWAVILVRDNIPGRQLNPLKWMLVYWSETLMLGSIQTATSEAFTYQPVARNWQNFCWWPLQSIRNVSQHVTDSYLFVLQPHIPLAKTFCRGMH